MRSELKRSQLKTFIYLRPLHVKSTQSTITCACVFFGVQMTFRYYYTIKEVYILCQVHLSMDVPFSKDNDIINIFIKPVVIIYSVFNYIPEIIQTTELNKVMSHILHLPLFEHFASWSINNLMVMYPVFAMYNSMQKFKLKALQFSFSCTKII